MKTLVSIVAIALLVLGSSAAIAKGPNGKGPASQAYDQADDNARFIRGEKRPQGKGPKADADKKMNAKKKARKGDSKKDRAVKDQKGKGMNDTPRDPEKIRQRDKTQQQDRSQQKERARDRIHVQENNTGGEDTDK
jgi:hypothetical protein